MSKILTLRRWHPVEYRIGDGPDSPVIRFKLKRMRFDEAGELTVANMEAFAAFSSILPDPTRTDRVQTQADILEDMRLQAIAAKKFYEAIPPGLMARLFKENIRDVEGVEDEDGLVTTGEQLYELADERLSIFVLGQLRSLTTISALEGKGSGSPSTSASEATSDSPSPAPSTGSEGGPIH